MSLLVFISICFYLINFKKIHYYTDFQIGSQTATGRRQTNEDAECIEKTDNLTILGIFDGHGGNQASIYTSQCLAEIIAQNEDDFEDDNLDEIQKSLQNAFNTADHKYIQQENAEDIMSCSGCTATVMVQHKDKLYFANAGDSRSIIIDHDYKVIFQTSDHKPSLPLEKQRIESYGSQVTQLENDVARVAGMLAVSRAIGDCPFKGCGVIATPDVYQADAENAKIIVLGCDGLWDVFTPEEVALICQWFMQYQECQYPEFQSQDQRLKDIFEAVKLYCQSDNMINEKAQQADMILDKYEELGLVENLNEVVISITDKFKAKHLASLLVRAAISIGSIDNVSVIVAIQ